MRGPVHETHINPGAAEGSRTPNLLITNQALCQLSYSGPLGGLYTETLIRSLERPLVRAVGERWLPLAGRDSKKRRGIRPCFS